jgi:hypothetical protein
MISNRVVLVDESNSELWCQQITDGAIRYAEQNIGHPNYGLIGYILSAEEYARDFPDAPPFELLTATYDVDFPIEEDARTLWKLRAKQHADLYAAQSNAKAELRALIQDTVPSDYFLQLRTVQGLATVTTAQLFAAVTDRFSQASPEMLAKVQRPLWQKFAVGDKLSSHLSMHVIAHKASDRLGCEIPDHDKVRHFLASLQGTGVWDKYIDEFGARYTSVKTRTWKKVMKRFPEYDVRRLNHTTSRDAGFAGAAQLEQLMAKNVQLQAQIDDLKAAVNAATAKPAVTTDQSRGRDGGGGGGRNRQAAAGNQYYCWSHGPNPTHDSADCRAHRLPAHDKKATLRDQRGGAPFTWSHKREREGQCPPLPHA